MLGLCLASGSRLPTSLQRVIYIQNLPTHATDGDLRTCFGTYGRIYKGMALYVRTPDLPARPPARPYPLQPAL